jgi:hypothetical protein
LLHPQGRAKGNHLRDPLQQKAVQKGDHLRLAKRTKEELITGFIAGGEVILLFYLSSESMYVS